MNIVKNDIDQNNATITISVVKADYAEKVEKTLRDYRKKANIPGFRPGMVPIGLIKKMYGKAVEAEELNKVVSDALYNYIRDNNIAILGEPLPNESQNNIDFETQEDFDFVFDIGLAPEFEINLSQKDKVNYYDIAVSNEMIENQIKSYTGRYGKYMQEEIVEEKDMLKGELLELATKKKVKEDGIRVEGAVLTPAYMQDEAQKKLFAGAKKGDTIVFNPKKAYANVTEVSSMLKISKEEAENFTADCQITIEGITRYHESEVNQDLFDKVYGEGVVTSEDEFRAKIKANIQENLIADSDYKFGIDAREMLVKKLDGATFPDAFLKRWLLVANENLTAEKIEEDFPKMILDLKWHLIKDKLAKANEVKIEPADVQEFAKKMTRAQFAQYGMIGIEDDIVTKYAQDMLKKEDTLKNIIDKVTEDKVLEAVKKAVKLNKKEISIEDFNKLFEAK